MKMNEPSSTASEMFDADDGLSSFRERFANYPVRVEVLSRFLTGKEQKTVIQGIADGSVDVVCDCRPGGLSEPGRGGELDPCLRAFGQPYERDGAGRLRVIRLCRSDEGVLRHLSTDRRDRPEQ